MNKFSKPRWNLGTDGIHRYSCNDANKDLKSKDVSDIIGISPTAIRLIRDGLR